MELKNCQVCQKACRPRRCTRCRMAVYCSVDCQKIDWKAGHKRVCKKSATATSPKKSGTEKKAEQALQELLFMTRSMPINKAEEHYHKAREETKRLQEEKKEEREESYNKSNHEENRRKKQHDNIPSKIKKENSTIQSSNIKKEEVANTQSQEKVIGLVPEITNHERIQYFVAEEMQNISKCQIRIKLLKSDGRRRRSDVEKNIQVQIHNKNTLNNNNSSSSSSNSNNNNTIESSSPSSSHVIIKDDPADEVLFKVKLNQRLDTSRCAYRVSDDDDYDGMELHLSLQYEEDLCGGINNIGSGTDILSVNDVNNVVCRFCEQPLLVPTQPIHRVCLLPEGHWDEIGDHLICYNGQPYVDFSSASMIVERSVALHGTNVICFNQNDMGNSICVLAVPGYGATLEEEEEEEKEGNDKAEKGKTRLLDKPNIMEMGNDVSSTIRGDRNWRDHTGGPTVCCSLCCSPLGFASLVSPESFHLLKHRLSVRSTPSSRTICSCVSFLGREMLRYAESKAIYTFVVVLKQHGRNSSHWATTTPQRQHDPCILLRLVSWDTNMATNMVGDGSDRLDFCQIAKVVYEETHDRLSNRFDDDITKWVWGGVDLCCAPSLPLNSYGRSMVDDTETTEKTQALSSVRLYLEKNEYDEIVKSLRQSRKFFSKQVEEATILVKMGIPQSDIRRRRHRLGLSAIKLV